MTEKLGFRESYKENNEKKELLSTCTKYALIISALLLLTSCAEQKPSEDPFKQDNIDGVSSKTESPKRKDICFDPNACDSGTYSSYKNTKSHNSDCTIFQYFKEIGNGFRDGWKEFKKIF